MKELLGGCLIAAGVIIAGLTGLCTLLGILSVRSWRSLEATAGMLVALAIPLAIGVGLIFAGRAIIANARSDRY
jgi:hypothetical protein